LQELQVAQVAALGLGQAGVQGLQHPGQFQGPKAVGQRGAQDRHRVVSAFGKSVIAGKRSVLVHNDCWDVDDDTLDDIHDRFGPDVAQGVEYNIRRYNEGDTGHALNNIGKDPAALAEYLARPREFTYFDNQNPNSFISYDASNQILVVQNAQMVHAYNFSLDPSRPADPRGSPWPADGDLSQVVNRCGVAAVAAPPAGERESKWIKPILAAGRSQEHDGTCGDHAPAVVVGMGGVCRARPVVVVRVPADVALGRAQVHLLPGPCGLPARRDPHR
jgi:hypothetical protein